MIEYELIRSNRKTLTIQVKPDGSVIVRAPVRLAKYRIAKFVKEKYHKKIRINTNGQGSLSNGKDIAPMMKGVIDIVSVSLNTPNEKRYNEIVRSRFGDQAYQAMLSFVKEVKKYVPEVVLSTVSTTITKEEEEECRKICEDLGVTYRIRPFE